MTLEGEEEDASETDRDENQSDDCDNGSKSITPKNSADKYVQTFFKFMINLSNRRFVEIINTPVDHADKSLVFYRHSDELLAEEK